MSECRCGKVRFLTKRHAKRAIRRMQSRDGRLHVYRCAGGFWHLGHQPGAITRGEVDRRDWKHA